MPPTDPADLIAQARREMGLSRQLEQPRLRLPPDPSRGGSTVYEEWFRERQIEKWENDEPIDVSESSLKRWRKRLVRYRPTGNHPRTQIIGHDMINLVTFLVGYPDATADEVIIFLYNQGGASYSRQVVYERLKELNITRKRASTEAYQASRPDVLHRKWTFWNCPPRLGVVGVPRRKFIDVDEFGIALEKCNRSYGWAPKIFRVRKEGHYTRGLKLTVLIAFEPGDPGCILILLVAFKDHADGLELCEGLGLQSTCFGILSTASAMILSKMDMMAQMIIASSCGTT